MMLCHATPPREACDPFELGMRAVDAGQAELVRLIQSGAIAKMPVAAQDKSLEIRCSRYKDFTDEVVSRYLEQVPTPEEIGRQLLAAPKRELIRPDN